MPGSQTKRLPLVLFGIYLLLYGGFIVINLFATELMELTPLAGVNLAIWYGFGLIIAAIILAFIYGIAGADQSDSPGDTAEQQEVNQ